MTHITHDTADLLDYETLPSQVNPLLFLLNRPFKAISMEIAFMTMVNSLGFFKLSWRQRISWTAISDWLDDERELHDVYEQAMLLATTNLVAAGLAKLVARGYVQRTDVLAPREDDPNKQVSQTYFEVTPSFIAALRAELG